MLYTVPMNINGYVPFFINTLDKIGEKYMLTKSIIRRIPTETEAFLEACLGYGPAPRPTQTHLRKGLALYSSVWLGRDQYLNI